MRTYYVYDDYQNLRYIIPPLASVKLKENNWVWNDEVNALVFYNYYDGRGRVTHKKVPGAGEVQMVYDKLDRLILSQDAVQREKQEWKFTKYDRFSRPVMTGIYTFDGEKGNCAQFTESRDILQCLADRAGIQYTIQTIPTDIIATVHASAFPVLEDCKVLSVSFYDDYDLNGDGVADISYDDQIYAQAYDEVSIPPIATSHPLQGQVTATKVRVLDTDIWLTTATFYNDKYRVIQTRSENYLGEDTKGLDILPT